MEIEELKAELAYVSAKLRRAEHITCTGIPRGWTWTVYIQHLEAGQTETPAHHLTEELHGCPTIPPVMSHIPAASLFASASMLAQLPPISRFTREDQPDGELFKDWHEQFESVAQLAGWDDH